MYSLTTELFSSLSRIFNGLDGMEIEDAGQLSKLTFLNISEADYGNYTCIAINKLGSSNASFVLYGEYIIPFKVQKNENILLVTLYNNFHE